MLNSCNFQGRLAADPELRTTQSGISVTSFRMAVDRSKADEDGDRQVDWLSFTAWRNTAEFICKYFSKGSQMVVESHCQTRKYQDKNGEDRIATEFIVDKAHFCGPKQSSRQEPVDDGGTNPPSSTYRSQQPQQPQQMGFSTQSQRQQWQGAEAAPEAVQPSYSQGNADDFSEINDTDDLPF